MGLYSLIVIDLLDEVSKSVALDTVADNLCKLKFTIPSWIPSGKIVEAKFKIAYDFSSVTDAVADILLKNVTDSKDIADSGNIVGGSSDEKNVDLTVNPDLIIGKQLQVHINVTTASATSGATGTVYSAKLLLGVVV